MSTDDSLSEDVSSSGALGHCCHADGDRGKGSEASLEEGTSEGTSASGLAGPEDVCTHASQRTGGSVEVAITPSSCSSIPHKIRSLCLSTEEAFGRGRSLPFINPSSLETLRALVQEIRSSGETDPEMWKDCEGRWLHLFQLVEKQYQEQILAQQEQYQCQVQLIQDEIKALVQLQKRQCGGPSHADYPSSPVDAHTERRPPPSPVDLPGRPPPSVGASHGNRHPSAPAPPPLSSTSPPPPPQRPSAVSPGGGADERVATVMSSGYGTLSVWETTGPPEQATPPGTTEEAGRRRDDHRWSPTHQEDTETTLIGCEQSSANETTPKAESASPRPSLNQHGTSKSSSSQPLTSWAQRHKLRPKKSKAGPGLASPQPPEVQEPPPPSPRDRDRDSPLDHTDLQNQHRSAAPSTYAFPLRRSDSLMSEASGLTYWRLDESELYRPLPDSFDSGAYLLLQDASMSMTEEHSRLSLREIYQSQKRTESRRSDWEGSLTPSPVSPQLLTPDPTVPPTRQSDRTSGFTSPSHFSSPSSFPPAQPRPLAATAAAVSPGDTDCTSNASSLSDATPRRAEPPPPGPASRIATQSPLIGRQRRGGAPLASEEEEGGRTHAPRALGPDLLGGETHSAPFGVGPPRAAAGPCAERAAALEDPVVVSLLRQNLREKHSRHVSDLKAYYECEIRALRDKLSLRDLPRDLEKSNQALRERCEHLERALTEASGRIQELENNNCILGKQLADWPERYAVAGATVATLQRRLEESKRSGSEKDALAAHLRTRVRQLEEAAQNARGEADESHARREREYKMLQDLLGEYDSLRTDHEGVKNNFVSTESKLFDANEQISELKRVISKLESQVKQLEYENQARSRHAPHSHTQPSGAGLYHHPDLLLSASKHTQEEHAYRSSPAPQSDQSNGGRKSVGPQTNQANGYRKPPRLPTDQSAGSDGSASSFSSASDSRRCSPPTVRDPAQETGGQSQEQAASPREPGRREGGPLTPLMRALIELEETRATESRAPWLAGRRPTVGFIERSHSEAVGERGRPTADGGGARPSGRGGASPERRGLGPERGAAVLRARRSLSPEGHRSSSLPPQGQRTIPPATPTKRETLLLPLSAKSSPKRCPTENYSTAFGQPLPQQQQHLHNRFDVPLDQRRHSFHSASPRKRLHFTTQDRTEASRQSCGGLAEAPGSAAPAERGPWLGWEQQGTGGEGPGLQEPGEDSVPWSLGEAERLFDELTQEKGQIEAALSRMPVAGGRLSLQTRLDEVALEERLETVNRELGCLRMTLKRFHVLRSSAHT